MKKKYAFLLGLACLGLTACASSEKTAATTAAVTTEASTEIATESSVAETEESLSGVELLDSLLTSGDTYAVLETDNGKLFLHALDAFKDDSDRIYASAADVIGFDNDGQLIMYGTLSNHQDNQFIAMDEELHFYEIGSDFAAKYKIDGNMLTPVEFVVLTEMNESENTESESAEAATEETKQESRTAWEYMKDGETTTLDDNSKYQEMLSAYEALDPIEFTMKDGGDFTYTDLSSLLYPVGEEYPDEIMETAEAESETETDAE